MRRNILIAALAYVPLALLAQQPDRLSSTNVTHATATVEAVNADARALVLRDGDGEKVFVVAGPGIRNFEQIEVGDRVVATYKQAILAEVRPKGADSTEPSKALAKTRSAPGERPGGAISASVATNVVIESVDQSFDTVTFKRSDGIVRTVAVEDPKASEFVQRLKPGDEVQVTYTEATAIALLPAQ